MTTVGSRKFWSEFIDIYKSLPATWQVKSEKYKNRQLKSDSYDKLVDKLREIDKTANRATAVKRINNLRVCYRRELKKVLRSEQNATCDDDVYVPSLWYYDRLYFLRTNNDETAYLDDLNQSESVSETEDVISYENESDDSEYNVYRNVRKRSSTDASMNSTMKMKKILNVTNTNHTILDETPVDNDILLGPSTSMESNSPKKSSIESFCEFLALQIEDAQLTQHQVSALQIELLKKVHQFIPNDK